MILFQKSQNFAYLQMNKALDYVSIKSEIGNYTNFIKTNCLLDYSFQRC
jgi:hypothetical protein